MKKITLTLAIAFILFSGFMVLHPAAQKGIRAHFNPGEEYALSKQYPEFGEGLNEYKKAALKEMLRMRKSRNIDVPWLNEGPFNTGGRLNCVAIHPTAANTYLVGCADGGIFKTTDDGANWTPIFDTATSLSVSSIVYNQSNPNIVYAGTGDQVLGGYSHMGNGIYKSTDGGTTWINSGLNNVGAVTKIIIDPTNSNILYAGTTGNPFISDINRGVYKSTDGGATWNNILFLGQNAGIGDIVMNPANSSILFATGRRRIRSDVQSIIVGPEARIYRTTDAGLTWDTLTNGLPTGPQSRIGLCISSSNPDLLFANYVDTSLDFGGIYKSTNGGNSWSLVNTTSSISMGGFGWYFGEIRLDPNNNNILYLLSVRLYKSTNGGVTFTSDNGLLHADKHDLQFVNSNTLLLATDGGFYKSTNAGSGWSQLNNFPITQFYEIAHNPWDSLMYYGGAQDNGTNQGSQNSGLNNWIHYYGGDGFRPQFDPFNDQVMYAEWQNGNVVASDNGGSFFSDITNSITATDRCSWNAPYFVSKSNQDVLYFGSYMVYKNTSGPFDSWVPISPDLTNGTNDGFHVITTIDQSPLNDQVLYAGTSDARVWVTQNDGGAWTLINAGLTNRNISCVAPSPDSVSHVMVSQTGYRNNDSLAHIYYSENYGSSWSNIAGNLPVFAINDIWIQPGSHDSNIVIASDGGVYATKNRGVFWERVGNNMPIIPVYDLDYNPATKRLMAGTFARSMMTMRIDSIFKIKTQNTDGIAESVLNQFVTVYPNPSNRSFNLQLNHLEFKYACVYDMRGSLIKRYDRISQQYTCDELTSGYYILSIMTDQGRVNKQLIVQH